MEDADRKAREALTKQVHGKANRVIDSVVLLHEQARQIREIYREAWDRADVPVPVLPAHLKYLFGTHPKSFIATIGDPHRSVLKEAAQKAPLESDYWLHEGVLELLGPEGFAQKVSGQPRGLDIRDQLYALLAAGHGAIALRLARQRGQLDSLLDATSSFRGRSDIGLTVQDLVQTVTQSTLLGWQQQGLAKAAVWHAFSALGPEAARGVFTTLTKAANESIARGALDGASGCETLVTTADITRLKPVLQDYWSHLTDRESYPAHAAPDPGAINRLVAATSLVALEIEEDTFSPSEMERLHERRFALKRVAQWIRNVPAPFAALRDELTKESPAPLPLIPPRSSARSKRAVRG